MSQSKLILIGGGGHCKSCIDVIQMEGKYQIVGILDIDEKIGTTLSGIPYIGTDADIEKHHNQGIHFIITVGQIKTAALRVRIFQELLKINANIAIVISPKAVVSPYAKIGLGTIVMHNSIVNAGATIGVNNILNTACCIEHDVAIGNHCHIATGAFINGDCVIGDQTFIGSQAAIANQISIGKNVIIGIGSVVINNIEDNSCAVGNPSKIINK